MIETIAIDALEGPVIVDKVTNSLPTNPGLRLRGAVGRKHVG